MAVKGGSIGVVSQNSIRGGGVAGVLVQGNVRILGNRFQGAGAGQGSAVWVWKDSNATVANNHFTGYRNAVNASGSRVTAMDNVTRNFTGPSIIVKKPSSPPRVHGNTAISDSPKDSAVDIEGAADAAQDNMLKKPAEVEKSAYPAPPVWAFEPHGRDGNGFHELANTARQVSVQDGRWKLVATYGKKTSYALFDTENDPQEKTDLAARLEQIAFRLQGLLEKREGLTYQAELGGGTPAR